MPIGSIFQRNTQPPNTSTFLPGPLEKKVANKLTAFVLPPINLPLLLKSKTKGSLV